MGASRNRELAALKKAYARMIGKSDMTARRHCNGNHPDWVKFMQTQAITAVVQPAGEGRSPEQVAALTKLNPVMPEESAAPDELSKDDVLDNDDLSGPQKMEVMAWQIWVDVARKWKEATRVNQPDMVMAYAATAIKAREQYIKAKDAREAWDITERRLIPMGEFQALREGFILPLANLLRDLPGEIALLVNPENPDLARTQAAEWVTSRAQPQIQMMLEELKVT